MVLIVEDGSNVANADSYISVADADTYHAARGNTAWAAASETAREQALRRATPVLDDNAWQGVRTFGKDQSLRWPRNGVADREGYSIGRTEIPENLRRANAELALREVETPGSLTPDVVQNSLAKREKIGPIDVEYASVTASGAIPIVSIIGSLIEDYLEDNSSSTSITARAARV